MREAHLRDAEARPGRSGARRDGADGARARGARRRARRALRLGRARGVCRRTRACTSSARARRPSAARGSPRRSRASCGRARSASSRTWCRSTRCSLHRSCGRSGSRSCSGTRTGRDTRSSAPPRSCATAIVSVDRALVPARVEQGARDRPRHRRLASSPAPTHPTGPLRALVLGRYSPAKGLETILARRALAGRARRGARLRRRRSRRTSAELARDSPATPSSAVRLPRAEVPALFARSHVLINNMRAGAPDKVVYEAAASCLPVLASNPVFDDLLPPELRFDRDDPESLAERLRALDRGAGRSCASSSPATTPSSTGPTACSLRFDAHERRHDPPSAEGRRHLRLGGAPARRCCRGCASAAGTCAC